MYSDRGVGGGGGVDKILLSTPEKESTLKLKNS